MLMVSSRLRLEKKLQICLVACALVRLLLLNAFLSSRWKASRWLTRVLTNAPNSLMADAMCDNMWNLMICNGWTRSLRSTNVVKSSGQQHGQDGRLLRARPRKPRQLHRELFFPLIPEV